VPEVAVAVANAVAQVILLVAHIFNQVVVVVQD
jgi:hypothetical protein